MLGDKSIETRTHNRFRSLLGKRIGIHAGMSTDTSAWDNPYLSKKEKAMKMEDLLHGVVLGTAFVYDFQLLNKSHSKMALVDCGSTQRWGLFLNEINVFNKPVPAKGEMGIWYFNLKTKLKVKKAGIPVK
jgi:hypothetical protein